MDYSNLEREEAVMQWEEVSVETMMEADRAFEASLWPDPPIPQEPLATSSLWPFTSNVVEEEMFDVEPANEGGESMIV